MTIRDILATPTIPFAPEAGGTGDPGGDDGDGDDGGGSTAATGGGGDTGGHAGGDAKTVAEMMQDESLQQDPSLQKFDSIEKLAQSYSHLERMRGKDQIPMPTDENDTETWGEVYKRLGRPDDPSEYELPGVSEDSLFEPNDEFLDGFKQKAHELGLTNKQVHDLWGWYVEDVAEPEIQQTQEKAAQFREESEAALKKEFGNAYDENLQYAKEAVNEYGGDELKEVLEQTGLGNHPAIVKTFAQLGKDTLAEDTVGGSSKKGFDRSPQQAMEEIKSLRQDKNFMDAYTNPTNAGHQDAVDRMYALYRDAYPEQ